MFIQIEKTPNDNALKFILDKTLIERGSLSFSTPSDAKQDPLSYALMSEAGVASVLINKNYVIVSKKESESWDFLKTKVISLISDYSSDYHNQSVEPAPQPTTPKNYSSIEQEIVKLLDEYVKPFVEKDGGEIEFARYESGIVYLIMRGACNGCPSSTITLKRGVYQILKMHVPEIQDVQQHNE